MSAMDRIVPWVFTILGLIAIFAALSSWTGCRTVPEPSAPTPPHGGERVWNLEGRQPHLVAHYMPWFEVTKDRTKKPVNKKPIATRLPSSWYDDEREEDVSSKSWRHWKWENGGPVRDPDQRWSNDQRKIASVGYPLIGPYNSRSRDVIRYHLRTAKAAGIQAFLVDWYGPGTFEDDRINLLLDEAEKAGMKVAICYEEKINFKGFRDVETRDEAVANVVSDLTYILERYTSHPAYLKRNRIPFIYQFNGWGKGPAGPNLLTPPEWRDVFAELPSPVVYGRQNLDEEYYPPIQGGYVWWNPDAAWLESVARRAGELKRNGRLSFFMSMICPGFDDTGVWGWGSGPRRVERVGLETLRQTFELSALGEPELVQIVTWNDFGEGTMVEPSREIGFWYLDALETWWGERTGRPVNLADNREPFLDYAARCSEDEKAELPEPPFDSYLAQQPVSTR
jgi:hypothetical protein